MQYANPSKKLVVNQVSVFTCLCWFDSYSASKALSWARHVAFTCLEHLLWGLSSNLLKKRGSYRHSRMLRRDPLWRDWIFAPLSGRSLVAASSRCCPNSKFATTFISLGGVLHVLWFSSEDSSSISPEPVCTVGLIRFPHVVDVWDCHHIVIRCLKLRLGGSLQEYRRMDRGSVEPFTKMATHKSPGTSGSLLESADFCKTQDRNRECCILGVNWPAIV